MMSSHGPGPKSFLSLIVPMDEIKWTINRLNRGSVAVKGKEELIFFLWVSDLLERVGEQLARIDTVMRT